MTFTMFTNYGECWAIRANFVNIVNMNNETQARTC